MTEDLNAGLTSLTADVVSAYVSNNKISAEDLGKLIGSTYEALKTAGQPEPSEPEVAMPDKAAIRKSQHPDHLVSFIDGRKYKSLKRHLSTHDMTPGDYRKRYGLPSDYPMVAPSYSAQRSQLARSLGLGRKASPPETTEPAKPAARSRRKTGETTSQA